METILFIILFIILGFTNNWEAEKTLLAFLVLIAIVILIIAAIVLILVFLF